jgi:hypothetical protein
VGVRFRVVDLELLQARSNAHIIKQLAENFASSMRLDLEGHRRVLVLSLS